MIQWLHSWLPSTKLKLEIQLKTAQKIQMYLFVRSLRYKCISHFCLARIQMYLYVYSDEINMYLCKCISYSCLAEIHMYLYVYLTEIRMSLYVCAAEWLRSISYSYLHVKFNVFRSHSLRCMLDKRILNQNRWEYLINVIMFLAASGVQEYIFKIGAVQASHFSRFALYMHYQSWKGNLKNVLYGFFQMSLSNSI